MPPYAPAALVLTILSFMMMGWWLWCARGYARVRETMEGAACLVGGTT